MYRPQNKTCHAKNRPALQGVFKKHPKSTNPTKPAIGTLPEFLWQWGIFITHSVLTYRTELVTHSLVCLNCRHTWGFLPWVNAFHDTLKFNLPDLAGGTLGVTFFSRSGLLFLAEMIAHLGFPSQFVTHRGPHKSDSLTESSCPCACHVKHMITHLLLSNCIGKMGQYRC